MKNEVIIIHDYFNNFGGGERLINSLSEDLNAKIITGFINRNYLTYLNNNIINLKIRFSNNKYLRTLSLILKFFFLSGNLECKKVIFSGSYSIFSIRKFKNKKKIIYLHCLPKHIYHNIFYKNIFYNFFFKKYLSLFKFFYEKNINQADVIFCNSEYTKKNLLANISISHIDIKVIYPPVNLSKFNLQNINYKNYFLVNSRHEKDKNIDLVIKSFKKLKYNLYITGSGSMSEELKNIANSSINIFFLGTLSDEKYISVLKNSMATIQLSKNEDFGMSVIESLACGKVVFCFKAGGFVEYLEDQKNCFFINQKNIINDLIQKIEKSKDFLINKKEYCNQSILKFSHKKFIESFYEI